MRSLRLPVDIMGWFAIIIVLLSMCGATQRDISESVYQVRVDHCASPENQWATGVIIASDTLITVAHSLSQAETVHVLDSAGDEQEAEIIYLDDNKDIAMLRLTEAAGPVITIAEPNEEAAVTVATFSGPGNPVTKSAEILDLVEITLDGEGRRSGMKLRAEIDRGDSGAPVVNQEGQMVGMIFATARGDEVGWAIAASEVDAALGNANLGRPKVIPPTC